MSGSEPLLPPAALQALDQAEHQWQPGAQRHVVEPADLRKALAALQGRNYAEGDMHDAGGCCVSWLCELAV